MNGSTWVSLVLLIAGCSVEQLLASEKCLSVITPDIEECKSKHADDKHSLRPCVSNGICNKTFNVTIIKMEPLSSVMLPHLLSHLLDRCCGNCSKTRRVYTPTSAVTKEGMSSADFAFPVLGDSKASEMYGFNFIPLVEASNAYYITKEAAPGVILGRLIDSCLELWPLLVISLLMAAIAGFPIWLMDTWFNKEEFPRSFFIGLFEECDENIRNFQLHEHRARDGIRGVQTNSFYFRSARNWNSLPNSVVSAENINTFKNRLDEEWKDHPTKFDQTRHTARD